MKKVSMLYWLSFLIPGKWCSSRQIIKDRRLGKGKTIKQKFQLDWVEVKLVISSKSCFLPAWEEFDGGDARWVEWLWNRRVLGHSLVRLLVRSHRSLIRLICTARALHYGSFVRSLTRSQVGKKFLSMKLMRRFHKVLTHCGMMWKTQNGRYFLKNHFWR